MKDDARTGSEAKNYKFRLYDQTCEIVATCSYLLATCSYLLATCSYLLATRSYLEKELPESVTCLYFRSNMCLSLFVLFTDMFVLLDLYVPLIQYLGWWRNCWCLI
ncbi:hypothetical protein EB796_014578 [Bugula neritina]|uniref:Uncharacterized protein n=1 Tax=Bugula neritina TaxID=10212 RepID=A0A7J7JL91_BUGNE|nr:hypothetical protein EB796_014578 [Bugula neritina]